MRLARIGLVVLSLAFMVFVFLNEWERLRTIEWAFRFDLMALSLLGAVVLFFLDAYGWHLILRALGCKLAPGRAAKVWLVSSLSRYIPGGVWSYTSRVALAKAEGVDIATATMSLYFETVLLMVTSLAIGSAALLSGAQLHANYFLAVVVCCLLAFTVHPRAVLLAGRIPGRIGAAMRKIQIPTGRSAFFLYAYYLVFWFLFGAVFALFAYAIYPVTFGNWVPIGSAMALSFFAGFVVFFAPGGIGVRESALYLMLLPFMPGTASLAISIGSRLWIMAAEFISVTAIVLLDRVRTYPAVRSATIANAKQRSE